MSTAATSATAAQQPQPAASEQANATSVVVDVGGFEEDDEFEEFEEDDWPVTDEATKEDEWDEDWDDDLVEGDFVTQLRQELQATSNQGK